MHTCHDTCPPFPLQRNALRISELEFEVDSLRQIERDYKELQRDSAKNNGSLKATKVLLNPHTYTDAKLGWHSMVCSPPQHASSTLAAPPV